MLYDAGGARAASRPPWDEGRPRRDPGIATEPRTPRVRTATGRFTRATISRLAARAADDLRRRVRGLWALGSLVRTGTPRCRSISRPRSTASSSATARARPGGAYAACGSARRNRPCRPRFHGDAAHVERLLDLVRDNATTRPTRSCGAPRDDARGALDASAHRRRAFAEAWAEGAARLAELAARRLLGPGPLRQRHPLPRAGPRLRGIVRVLAQGSPAIPSGSPPRSRRHRPRGRPRQLAGAGRRGAGAEPGIRAQWCHGAPGSWLRCAICAARPDDGRRRAHVAGRAARARDPGCATARRGTAMRCSSSSR